MRTYHLTSTAWDGYIEFTFDERDLLAGMANHANLSQSQQVYLLKHMPREIAELDNLKTPHTTITEIHQEVTFEMFWDRYDDKISSSRKRTQKAFEKMPPAQRVRAYNFISRYFSSIPPGTRKKYAETYLNAELWNN